MVAEFWWPEAAILPSYRQSLDGWKPLGYTSLDYSIPSRWVIGASSPVITTPLKNLSQEAIDLYFGKTTCNERSRMNGITRQHEYVDGDGDSLQFHPPEGDEPSDVIAVVEAPDGFMPWIHASDPVPIALNVLGHDRPLPDVATTRAAVGRCVHVQSIPAGSDSRDSMHAQAIALLLAVDIYDQREAARKAEEAAEAERAAERTRRREERNSANFRLHEAAANIGRVGIYGPSLAELTAALDARNAAQKALDDLAA